MGVLRQKCVPTYESFLNNSNLYNIGFKMTYKAYLKEIDNESRLKIHLLWSNEKIFSINLLIEKFPNLDMISWWLCITSGLILIRQTIMTYVLLF